MLQRATVGKAVVLIVLVGAAVVIIHQRDAWKNSEWVPPAGLLLYFTLRAVKQLIAGVVPSEAGNINSKAEDSGQQQSKVEFKKHLSRLLRWARKIFLSLLVVGTIGGSIWLIVTLVRWFWLHPLFGKR